MAHSDAIPIVEDLLADFAGTLTNEDETITGLIAGTNSFGWGFEGFDNLKAWFKGRGKLEFTVTLYFSGEQDEDKPWSGSEIEADIKGKASTQENSNIWEITEYEIVKADYTDF
ncbi:hypothetical protein B4U84_28890 [Westiellopsis prolifica IICB1]|nr:hypothetical protein B4U84_28890 [Westiellopsis prolifica IICB1]